MFLWQAISLVHRGLLTNYSRNPTHNTAPTTSPEPAAADPTETPLSRDAERALEMVRKTLAMKSVNTKHQTANDVATRMREHLAGARKQRPRARIGSLSR